MRLILCKIFFSKKKIINCLTILPKGRRNTIHVVKFCVFHLCHLIALYLYLALPKENLMYGICFKAKNNILFFQIYSTQYNF